VRFFVSYSHKDSLGREIAAKLKRELRALLDRPRVFWDYKLKAGTRWPAVIRAEVERCDVFVWLVSPEAIESEEVRKEVDAAFERRAQTGGCPVIIPVRTTYDGPLERFQPDTHITECRESDDIATLAYDIRDTLRGDVDTAPIAKRPLTLIASLATFLLLATLALLATYPAVRALQRAQNDRAARDAYASLRVAQRLLVPRLWLIGAWNPQSLASRYFEARATALDAEAQRKLADRRRVGADDGMLAASLAAFKRGTTPSSIAQTYYDAQNYQQLITTIRDVEPVQGVALAVLRTATHTYFADGPHVARCTLQWQCESAKLSIDAARDAAFVSETKLVTITPEGRVDQWDLDTFVAPVGSELDLGGAAQSIASHDGMLAVAIAGQSLYLSSGKAPDRIDVRRVTFGPCDTCITMLTDRGLVDVWDYVRGAHVRTMSNAKDIATSRGHLAIAWSDGGVSIDDKPRVAVNAEDVDRIAISDDGRNVAIAHDGVVTLIDDNGVMRPLIPADRKPAPVAVAWSGALAITRTPTELRVWSPSQSKQRDVGPGDAWREWRKQLGVTGRASELGWNRAELRIDEQQ